jgi:hypothetical protein
MIIEGKLCALVLTAGTVCSKMTVAARIPACLIAGPNLATGGHHGCFANVGFPTGIGSILTPPALRPSHDPRKNLHAPRIRAGFANHQRSCARSPLVQTSFLPQNRRPVTNLAERFGRVPAPYPDTCPGRSLCCIIAPLKMKGARWFARVQSPEATPVLWHYTSTETACDGIGPPPGSRRPFGSCQRTERCVKKQRGSNRRHSTRSRRYWQRFTATAGGAVRRAQ